MTLEKLQELIQNNLEREIPISSSAELGENTIHLDGFYKIEPLFYLQPNTRVAGCGYQSRYMTEATCVVTDFEVKVIGAKVFDEDWHEVELTNDQQDFIVAALDSVCYCEEEIISDTP